VPITEVYSHHSGSFTGDKAKQAHFLRAPATPKDM